MFEILLEISLFYIVGTFSDRLLKKQDYLNKLSNDYVQYFYVLSELHNIITKILVK
jgi:hypothetical protein